MKSVLREIGWFVGVGCAAAATHWVVAVTGIGRLHLAPAVANLVGWLVALVVSFSGHYLLTFRHHAKSLLPALGRFFLLSASGFAVNELAFVVLLHSTRLPYQHLLAAILVAVAILTFLLSRSWAFRHTP
ncbi:MAG: GtrA family protein [Candidatus Accumulibacter sp.]|uniref:GtrA family protein n=1 Tax=Accumulibacter sp. TaxID=2053492 RepID=UPI002878D1E3|nr:GtrA family protein [Accumulibacter sp.]MDS4013043.1 GtrA family protein [Accumulibacter sp.]